MKKYYNILHVPTGLWVYKYHPTCHTVELTKTPRKVLYGKTKFNPSEFNHTNFLVIDGKYIPYSDESFFDVSPMDFEDPINLAAVRELYTNALDPNVVYKVIEL